MPLVLTVFHRSPPLLSELPPPPSIPGFPLSPLLLLPLLLSLSGEGRGVVFHNSEQLSLLATWQSPFTSEALEVTAATI